MKTLFFSLLSASLLLSSCTTSEACPPCHQGDGCHAAPAAQIEQTEDGTHALILLLLSDFANASDDELSRAERHMLDLAADMRADGEPEHMIQLCLALEPEEAAEYITPNR